VFSASFAQATDWRVGVGAGNGPQYEGSDDYGPVPLITVLAQDLYHPETYVGISNTVLRSNFLAHPNLRAGISAEYVAERGAFNDIDNDRVDALSDTDDGLLLGVLIGYETKFRNGSSLIFEIDPRYDVSDEIGGKVKARVRYNRKLGTKWVFLGEVESTYASESYMNNLFGVNAKDSGRTGLDQFNADAGIMDASVRATATYLIARSWSATFVASVKQLLGDAADSPITDDEGDATQLFGGASLNFHF
jgi:outer membrane protein